MSSGVLLWCHGLRIHCCSSRIGYNCGSDLFLAWELQMPGGGKKKKKIHVACQMPKAGTEKKEPEAHAGLRQFMHSLAFLYPPAWSLALGLVGRDRKHRWSRGSVPVSLSGSGPKQGWTRPPVHQCGAWVGQLDGNGALHSLAVQPAGSCFTSQTSIQTLCLTCRFHL